MFDSDDETRVYSLGEQLMCYLDANYSVCQDMAFAVAMALSRCHGIN